VGDVIVLAKTPGGDLTKYRVCVSPQCGKRVPEQDLCVMLLH